MKYMLMTFGDQSGLAGKSPDWIKGMIEFMIGIDVELNASGELVFQQGLADPSVAKTVRMAGGTRTAADGSVAAPPLAGFWIVDVIDEARAFDIAGRISEAAEAPIEVRACMDAPPDDVLEQLGIQL